MLNWVKHNRKVLKAGLLKEERVEKFKELLDIMAAYRRKTAGRINMSSAEA